MHVVAASAALVYVPEAQSAHVVALMELTLAHCPWRTGQAGRCAGPALHFAASNHGDPAVLELLIREYPLALCATSSSGHTPLQIATLYNHSAA